MSNVTKWLPWVIAAVISIIAVKLAIDYAERVEDEHRIAYDYYADSLATVRHSDSISFREQIEKLTFDLTAVEKERDSIERKLSTQAKSNTVVYRTVYKDSIREVVIENKEVVSVYEERIAHVRDSLNQIIAQKDGVSVEYVEKVVHDTIVQYVTHTDSVYVNKTVEKKDGPIGIYASGKVGYGTDGIVYGADAGVKYYVFGPLYGKIGVEYDGKVSGVAGVGVDIRF